MTNQNQSNLSKLDLMISQIFIMNKAPRMNAPSTPHQRPINASSTPNQRPINAPSMPLNAPSTPHQRPINAPSTSHQRPINNEVLVYTWAQSLMVVNRFTFGFHFPMVLSSFSNAG